MSTGRVISALFIVVCCAYLAQAQGPKTTAPIQVATDQEQYVAYWTTEANWHSELQLRNNSPSTDLIVTPGLRASDGSETVLTA